MSRTEKYIHLHNLQLLWFYVQVTQNVARTSTPSASNRVEIDNQNKNVYFEEEKIKKEMHITKVQIGFLYAHTWMYEKAKNNFGSIFFSAATMMIYRKRQYSL